MQRLFELPSGFGDFAGQAQLAAEFKAGLPEVGIEPDCLLIICDRLVPPSGPGKSGAGGELGLSILGLEFQSPGPASGQCVLISRSIWPLVPWRVCFLEPLAVRALPFSIEEGKTKRITFGHRPWRRIWARVMR